MLLLREPQLMLSSPGRMSSAEKEGSSWPSGLSLLLASAKRSASKVAVESCSNDADGGSGKFGDMAWLADLELVGE